jgi:hypothetical protein
MRLRGRLARDSAHRGPLSSTTAKLMVFKLIIAASKTWRRLNGANQLPNVIGGVRFHDGIEIIEAPQIALPNRFVTQNPA